MFLLIYVSVLFFGVEAHIKFTECQAEFYRSQPGNEDVVFETDGIPCQAEARALTAYNSRWNNIVIEQTIKLNTVINDLESRKRMEKNMRVKNKIKHSNPELLRKELDKTSILAAFR